MVSVYKVGQSCIASPRVHSLLMCARLAAARNALATFVSLWMCGIPIIYWGVLGKWRQFGCCVCLFGTSVSLFVCESKPTLCAFCTCTGQGWGLEGLWMMLWPLYSVLCTLQYIGYTTKDWEAVSDRIIARLRARCE